MSALTGAEVARRWAEADRLDPARPTLQQLVDEAIAEAEKRGREQVRALLRAALDDDPVTAPERLDRVGFDRLLNARLLADASDSRRAADTDARKEALDEAALLEAEAHSFADAVDRSGLDLPYEDAVVINGTSGPVVVSVADYDRERVYHEARAGEVDGVTIGPQLMAVLRA